MFFSRGSAWSYLAFVILVVYAAVAAGWGLSADADSALLWSAAGNWAEHGEYVRSRTSGFPFYEALLALLIKFDGNVWLANVLSTLWAGVALWAAGHVVGVARAGIARMVLVLWPIFLIASAEPMETMQALALGLLLVRKVLDRPRLCGTHAVLAVLLVLTRLDAAILVIAVASVAVWRGHLGACRGMTWLAVCGLASLIIYATLNSGFQFLRTDVLGLDAPLRRLIRAAAGFWNALPLVAWPLLSGVVLKARGQDLSVRESHLAGLLVIALPLYALRFMALPDEIFYLAIPVCLILLLGVSCWPSSSTGLFLIIGLWQCFGAVSWFERLPGVEDRLIASPKLGPGPLWQEYEVRRAFLALRDPVQRKALSCKLFQDCPSLTLSHTGPALVTRDGRAIVSARYRYMFSSVRYPDFSGQPWRLTVCRQEIVPSTPGWRVLQPGLGFSVTENDLRNCVVE